MTSISQIHFTRRSAAQAAIIRSGIIAGQVERKGMYFYITKGTYAGGKSVTELMEVATDAAAEREAPAFKRPENADGLCARIRAFSLANPHATVEDARDAFPDANKSTVQIQFKKARK